MTNGDITPSAMPGALALPLLQEISGWQNTTTIILHGGSVFEFKGVFPSGEVANGFYNLSGANGFEGHLNLAKIDHIAFQSKKHRGQESHAFVFNNKASDCIFKIFVGRDADGTLHESQKKDYLAYQQKYLSGALV